MNQCITLPCTIQQLPLDVNTKSQDLRSLFSVGTMAQWDAPVTPSCYQVYQPCTEDKNQLHHSRGASEDAHELQHGCLGRQRTGSCAENQKTNQVTLKNFM